MSQDTIKGRRREFYGPQWYEADPAAIAEAKKLKPWRPVLAAALAWLWIFVVVKLYLMVPEPWFLALYPLAALLIAGRAGVFLQLAHEAAHGLISKGRFNNWFGDWVACYPIGLDFKGYQEPHMRHHACTNQVCDPLTDSEKYKVCDVRNPKLWLLFLKDILGITAVSVRFMYDQPLANKDKREIEDYLETEEGYQALRPNASGSKPESLKKYVGIAFMQFLILTFLFDFDPIHYVFLWGVPLVTAHMFLMRVRGIAEHGLGIQLGVTNLQEKTRGTFYTRSFGTPANQYPILPLVWIERMLIGSLRVYYHHEHHLFPKVPYYNLSKVHKLVADQVAEQNPCVYARGYFDCLFFPLQPHPEVKLF